MRKTTVPVFVLVSLLNVSLLGQSASAIPNCCEDGKGGRGRFALDTGLSPEPLDIETITVSAGPSRFDGDLNPSPYFIEAFVEGQGILGVQLTTPNGSAPIDLAQVSDSEWSIEADDYDSLAEIAQDPLVGFGDFLFEFLGAEGEVDSVTVRFDPGTQDAFSGYPNILSPQHNATDVSLQPTFRWSCAGICGSSGWDLQVVHLTGPGISFAYDEFLPDPGSTQWTPGPLAPSQTYSFWNSSVELLDPTPLTLLTDGGDAFTYAAAFVSFNEISFSTASAGGCLSKGDATCDGATCNLFDVLSSIDQALGREASSCEADVDCNDFVNLFDVLCFIDCALGRGSCLTSPCVEGSLPPGCL